MRLHYLETLKVWNDLFEAKLDLGRKIYDEYFCRTCRSYLIVSELAYPHNGHIVVQIQLANKQNAVPLARET